MKKIKVIIVDRDCLVFEKGIVLYSYHEPECCEGHYLSFYDLTLDDFRDLEFDLSNDDFFERIEGYGIALKATNGQKVRVPGYADNNGYYYSDLDLIVTNEKGQGVYKKYDISECQDWKEYND